LPAETADNSNNSAFKLLAYILAKVVLPHPGGPHKIKENRMPCSIAFRRGLFLPTKCSWPTNSSKFLGLIFEANGSIY
jgi:hypothetical protein